MRPFFSFYGSKWRAARNYPAPRYDLVIEPFAGGAGYSLHHEPRHVLLVEADPVVAGVWRYLLRVTPEEILALPDVPLDRSLDDLPLPQEARWLMGFWCGRALPRPRTTPSSWMAAAPANGWTGRFWGPKARQRIASQLARIEHWQLREYGYEESPNLAATWFIDPPYVGRPGRRYAHHAVRGAALAPWCRSRLGQVMVCEGPEGDWLPFRPLPDIQAMRGTCRERLWRNDQACATSTAGSSAVSTTSAAG